MGGNIYGKNNIWEIYDETFFFIPETIVYPGGNETIIFRHRSKLDSFLKVVKDSWFIYLCGVKRVYNQGKGRFYGGCAWPESGVAIVACYYIDSIFNWGINGLEAKNIGVAHEIGHLLGRKGHCESANLGRRICLMKYPN